MRQTVNGVGTYYALDAVGLPQVVAETTGAQTRQYVSGLAQADASGWSYPLPDGLGSVRQIANAQGRLFREQRYDPYGNVLVSQGFGGTIFGYTGEQVDPTGLVFLRARYYNPAIGVFLSKDLYPGDLRRPQSLNGFSYVEGNPVNRVDPSGLIGCIGGGNMAVMEFDNCVSGGHGGISSGQPVGGGVVPVAIVVGLVAWIYHQLPGFDLLPPQGGYDYTTPEIIQPCFSPSGTNIRPHPFWLPG